MFDREKMQRNAHSLTVKLIVITVLALLLLIPAQMVRSLIEERQMRRNQTLSELTQMLGGQQTLTGPVVAVPYRTYEKTGDGAQTLWHQAYFLPESLNISGNMEHAIRYRSIYKMISYNTQLEIDGHFSPLQFPDKKVRPDDILWEQAELAIGVSDMQGIQDNIVIKWNGTPHKCGSGVPAQDLFYTGVNTPVEVQPGKAFTFAFSLSLSGTKSLHFVPLGATTHVKLQSDWNTPSFSGEFSPDMRTITDDGFSSEWKVLQLNRSYPQQWTDNQYGIQSSAFGVDLIFPVDIYQKNMRSVKYAILFIGLTFITFFFAEQIHKRRIHPINYLLVGFALVIFYSLLFAISEHISFALSYLISSVAVVLLVSAFLHSLLRRWRVTLTIGLILTLLYSFLFVILEIYGYSLLLGNIGLFIILALLMFFSRKIDWYRTNGQTEE